MGNLEAPRCGGFLISEAPGSYSRDSISLWGLNDGVTVYPAGTVLAKITKGGTTVLTAAGNTGNGTIGAVTRSAGLQLGDYQLLCIKASTNSGLFTVEDPLGFLVGEATVGVAFNGGGLGFTIADGASDFVVGDRLTITVAAGTGRYRAWDPAGYDGREVAAAVLYGSADVSGSADIAATAITRSAEVKDALLNYGAADSGQIANANAQLKSAGIVVRAAV